MPFEPCRYLRYKELFTPELVAVSEEGNDIPAVANTWCNLTLNEVGQDDCPVSMIACSRPGGSATVLPRAVQLTRAADIRGAP